MIQSNANCVARSFYCIITKLHLEFYPSYKNFNWSFIEKTFVKQDPTIQAIKTLIGLS